MPKTGIATLLAATLALAATPVNAEDATAAGVARSASLMRQMVEACSQTFDIDRDMAERYVKAFTDAGENAFGKQAFARQLAREYARRAAEVKKAGAEKWCPAQRERVIELGGAALFSKP